MRFFRFALLGAIALALNACFVPADNPYDPATPSEAQQAAEIFGAAAYPATAGRGPAGITVTLRHPLDETVVQSAVTASEDGGTFRFSGVEPGFYIVEASADGFAPAVQGPFELLAGEQHDASTLALLDAARSSKVEGTVALANGVDAASVQVILRYYVTDTLSCANEEGRTQVSDDGSFVFGDVRPGQYRAIAVAENATVDMSAPFTVEPESTATLEAALSVQTGDVVMSLGANGSDGAAFTSTSAITVNLRNFGEMAQVRLGGDPLFRAAQGGTAYLSFQETVPFTLQGNEGSKTVFAQMRNSCVTTPVYSVDIAYDATPPVFFSARAEGQEAVGQPIPPRVILGDTRSVLDVTIIGQDLTGISGVQFLLDGDNGSGPFISRVPGAINTAEVFTEGAPLAAGEGLSHLRVRLRDAAGNTTPLEQAVPFAVLRDLSAPSTPVAAVADMEVTGKTALLWLDERECPAGNRSPYVCEANPADEGLFQVRGGPDLLDFTTVAGPPFEVTLLDEGATAFEIQARDFAGNVSPGVARVTVRRTADRELFVAPKNKALGIPNNPEYVFQYSTFSIVEEPPRTVVDKKREQVLKASGGVAFFSLQSKQDVNPRTDSVAGIDTYYSYLIAQPVDVSPLISVGDFGNQTSGFPVGIRKINVDERNLRQSEKYLRRAGALGALNGGISWMEYFANPRTGLGTADNYTPYAYQAWPNGNGRIQFDDFHPSGTIDLDEEPAPSEFEIEDCVDSGHLLCQKVHHSWIGPRQRPPSETISDGRHFLINGASNQAEVLDGVPSGTITVTGPKVIGVHVRASPDQTLGFVDGWRFDSLDVLPNTPVLLATASFEERSQGEDWVQTNSSARYSDFIAVPSTHLGSETFPAEIYTIFRNGPDSDDLVLGMLLPQGATATFDLVASEEVDGPLQPLGTLIRNLETDSDGTTPRLTFAPGPEDLPGFIPRMTIFYADNDPLRVGTVKGLTALDWGVDRKPALIDTTVADVQSDPFLLEKSRDESQSRLVSEKTRSSRVEFTEGQANLAVPPSYCSVLVHANSDQLISEIQISGRGILDSNNFVARVWSLEGASPFGRYSPAPGFNKNIGFASPKDNPLDCAESILGIESSANKSGELVENISRIDEALQFQVEGLVVAFEETNALPIASGNAGVMNQFANFAVSVGNLVDVNMVDIDGTGDVDLYVKFGSPPTFGDYDCRPYRNGSDETCSLEVPPGEDTVFISASNYYSDSANVSITTTIKTSGPVPRTVKAYPVSEGELIRVVLNDTTDAQYNNHDLYVRFNNEPTLAEWDCRSDFNGEFTDECFVVAPPDATELYVGVKEDKFDQLSTYKLDVQIVPAAAVSELPPLAGLSEQPFQVRVSGGAGADLLLVQPDSSQTSITNYSDRIICDTRDQPSNSRCDCKNDDATGDLICTGTLPSSEPYKASVLLLGGATASGSYDATVDLNEPGCTSVRSYNASGVLEAGKNYVVTLSSSHFNGNQQLLDLEWPIDESFGPSNINFKKPLSNKELGGLTMLGSASTSEFDANRNLNVTAYDATSPMCDISLNIRDRVAYKNLSAEFPRMAASREEFVNGIPQSTVISSCMDKGLGTNPEADSIKQLAPGRIVLATTLNGGVLSWVEANADGSEGELMTVDLEDQTGSMCLAATLDSSVAPLRIATADFDGDQLVLTGTGVFAPQMQRFRLSEAAGCRAAEFIEKRTLERLPVASALSGGDFFIWTEPPQNGGVLTHIDLRNVEPIHPGGRAEIVGFDVDAGDVVLSVLPRAGVRGARLLELHGDSVNPTLHEADTPRLQPTYLQDAIATVNPNGSVQERVMVRGRGRGQLTADVPLPEVESLFLGAPANAEASLLVWARTPILRARGKTLAVLGFDDAGQRLLGVYELGPTPADWAAASMKIGPISVADGVEELFVNDALVVVTFSSGRVRAWAKIPDDIGVVSWQELLGIEPFDALQGLARRQTRILGALDNQLAVLANPGDLFSPRPPNHAVLTFVDPVMLRDPLPTPVVPVDAGVADAGLADAGVLDAGGTLDAGTPPTPGVDAGRITPPEPCAADDSPLVMRLPAELFLHAFSTMERNADGDIYLYDTRAEPPLLWRLDARTGYAMPVDGPHRPLTKGSEILGAAALPRIDGDNVYYARQLDSGLGLMRMRVRP